MSAENMEILLQLIKEKIDKIDGHVEVLNHEHVDNKIWRTQADGKFTHLFDELTGLKHWLWTVGIGTLLVGVAGLVWQILHGLPW